MITNSKPSASFIQTDKLEVLARQLFNGALPKLSGDGFKRRHQLAKEFTDAHLTVPGVAKPDAAKVAALTPAFKAIAASRQARVDAYIAALPQPISHKTLRDKLVLAMGEQALQVKLLNCRHTVACALVMIDALEGRDTKLDLLANHCADGGKRLLDRLDGTLGRPARESLLPLGPLQVGAMIALLDGLGDAVNDNKAGISFADTTSKPTTPPRATASTSNSFKSASPGGSCKPAVSAHTKKTRADFDQLSARGKMDWIKAGGKLAD